MSAIVVGAAVIGAGASIYDTNKSINAQKSAIAPVQGAQSDLYSKAEDIANTPYTPYTGAQVAPLTGSQQQAIEEAQTTASNGIAQNDNSAATALAGQVANNGWNANTAAKYMNPYTQDVTNVAEKQLNQTYANTINAQNASAASSGAFGGDRATLNNAATTGEYLNTAENTAAINQANAYQSAIQTWQADNNRSLNAANAYETAGNDLTQMTSSQIKDLLATGGVAQATQQMQLNANYNDYLDKRNWSTTELQPLLSAVNSKATPAAVTPANTATDLMGLGSALAGYYGSNTNTAASGATSSEIGQENSYSNAGISNFNNSIGTNYNTISGLPSTSGSYGSFSSAIDGFS